MLLASSKAALFLGLGVGGAALVVLVAAVTPAVLPRTEWFRNRKRRREEERAETLQMEEFGPCTLDIAVAPHTMTFQGKAVDADEEVRDTLRIANKSRVPVLFGIVPKEGSHCAVALSVMSGEIAAGGTAAIGVACTKSISTDAQCALQLSVASKKDRRDGRHINIAVVLRGLASGELSLKMLQYGAQIGEGSFGVVYRGTYRGCDVAVKVMKHSSPDLAELFRREVEMLKLVHGRNVVAFYGAQAGDGAQMLHVTEFMDLGTLAAVLRGRALEPALKTKVARDIAAGMATVHSFNVVHSDLKPDNVLCRSPLSVDNDELCKITDFGTSRSVEHVFALTMTKGQGTPLYMAPEILSGHKRYTKAVDVYSYGVLCCQVWNDGQEPYAEYRFQSPLELQNAVLNGCRPRLAKDCPMFELIHKCWSPIVTDRPPFDAISV